MADEALYKVLKMGYDDQSKRPDKDKQRQQWNASWELDLDNTYKFAMQQRRRPKFVSRPEIKKAIGVSMQQRLLTQEKQLKSVIELQEDIVEYASNKRRYEDVAAAWTDIDDATRRDIALQSLYIVCSTGPDMEGYRMWCPDMTITSICENSGRLFLHYLSSIIAHWAQSPTLPALFHHAAVNRVNEEIDIDFVAQMHYTCRACFVSFVVWRILLGLYNDDENYVIGKAPKQTGHQRVFRNLIQASAKEGEGREIKAMVKEITGQYKKATAQYQRLCWTCGMDARRSKSGGPLKLCKECNKIGRQVWYCSSDCQKEDWKKGKPRPHRLFCGKPLEPTMFQEVSGEQLPNPSTSTTSTPVQLPEVAEADNRA